MRKMTWITCHLSQLDTTKCLVYFLSCLPPHKLWVAWPVEEMSRDRKEIEMEPPGLSGTLEQSPSNWDPRLLGTLQVWPAGTQIVAVRYWAWPGSSSVSGPSHTWVPAILGNNALPSLKPFQLAFSLPSHQLENYSWYNLTCWGAFCLCNVLEPFCQCIYFACYFNQVHECPAIWTDCQRGGNDPKSPGFTSFAQPSFLGYMCMQQVYRKCIWWKMKIYVEQINTLKTYISCCSNACLPWNLFSEGGTGSASEHLFKGCSCMQTSISTWFLDRVNYIIMFIVKHNTMG